MLITENNSIGNIDGSLSNSSTTLLLKSMTGMPVLTDVDDYCILTLIRESDGSIEYVRCTSQDIPAKTYTITRGQDGSTPLDFVDNDEARNLLTKEQINTLRDETLDTTVLREDGSVALTGDLDVGGNKIENVADAVNPDEVPNLQQVLDLLGTITTTDGVVLDTKDATNGGANNLSNIDITWNSSWDNYDRIVFLVEGLVNNTSGQIGWVLSNDAGSSWLTFVDSTGESQSWTDTNIPSNTGFNAKSVMEFGANQKAMECYYAPRIKSSTIKLNVPSNSNQGIGFQYNGSALTSAFTSSFVNAWHTSSNGLTGHLLRLAHDGGGTFTAGTVKIIGYNYPS